MRRNLWFSSAVGLSWLLLTVACSSTSSGTAPCTNASGCAAGEYCQGGDAGCAAKLAAGSPCVEGPGHTADDLCSSSICGGGNCCTAACANTDTACKSSGCDSTGACLYPDAGTVCGADAGCNGANFVPDSTCNGAGGCTPSTPVACAPYLCENGGCATTCRGTIDCDTGNYCASGLCAAQQDAGANCNGTSTSSPGEECSSNTCIGNHCCTAACPSTDNICRASACDTTGACVYPTSSTTCGPLEQCVAGQHTPPSGCGGDGTCVLSTAASCGVYNCDSIGKSCYTSCTVGDDSPCTNGNFCKAGHCSPQQGPGLPCLAPDACISGICQTNCCTAACGVDPILNCQGTCDNTGACGHPTCAPGYGCSGSQLCNTTCSADTDCAPNTGYTCSNPVNGSCCLPPVAGGIIYVDGKLGADTNCCDSASSPCMTITHAMKLVFSASATGATISVTWNGASAEADWNPATAEAYPIHLGMGVTLKAPGMFFTPPAGTSPAIDVFDVFAYNATDTGRVTIEGDPTVDFAYIGFDTDPQQAGRNLTATAVAVNASIGTAVPITLTDVWMNAQTASIKLGTGANVTVGPDQVIIGSGAGTSSPLPDVVSPNPAIVCQGSATGRATLQDDPAGNSILQIDSQDHSFQVHGVMTMIDACDVALTQGPVFGHPPPCPSPKVDGEGILVNGDSTLALTGAAIQCMQDHGMDIGETVGATSPTVTLDHTILQHTGRTALKCHTGSVGPVTNSTIFHNRFGALQENTCSVDLSGGGNTVACNTKNEPGTYGAVLLPAGIGVWNNTSNSTTMAADNVFWDTNPPSLWACTDVGATPQETNCTCVSGTCSGTDVAMPDLSDAVYQTDTGAISVGDAGASLQYPVCN